MLSRPILHPSRGRKRVIQLLAHRGRPTARGYDVRNALAIQLHRKRLSGLKQDTAKFRYFEGMPDPTSPSAAEDVKAEIAAIKVQITGLDETNKRLSSGRDQRISLLVPNPGKFAWH